MNQSVPDIDAGRHRLPLYLTVAGVLVGAGLLLYLLWGPTPQKIATPGTPGSSDNGLELVRKVLARDTDLNTCRTSLQQISSVLGQNPRWRSRPLAPGERDALHKTFELDEGELAEIDGSNYSLLDAHYLDQCFLMRDAVQAVDPARNISAGGAGPSAVSSLDRATVAFHFVVREMYLRQPSIPQTVPPSWALRRGWGSPLERALVFLEMLRQLGGPEQVHGCLVYLPSAPVPRLWACGVLVDNGTDVYLFDPRLGLPVPGPGGQGVATLAQARKDPAVLGQLTVSAKEPYDVTAEQAGKAELHLVCPLSALAPRQRTLQDTLLGSRVRVNLAANGPAELKRLSQAAQTEGNQGIAVRVWREGQRPDGQPVNGAGLVRRFLPRAEGGSDGNQPSRREVALAELIPWHQLPRVFRDEERFPSNVVLGQRVRGFFMGPFVGDVLDTNRPRDLLLRGRLSQALPELVQERDMLRIQRDGLNQGSDLEKKVDEWVKRAQAAFVEQIIAQRQKNAEALEAANQRIEVLWQEAGGKGAVVTLLAGAMAGPRLADVTYQLALCKQEAAEQLQARLTPAAPPEEVERTRMAWTNAQDWWRKYLEEEPAGPRAVAAHLQMGRTLAQMGEIVQARAAWDNLPAAATPLEKTAARFLAQQTSK